MALLVFWDCINKVSKIHKATFVSDILGVILHNSSSKLYPKRVIHDALKELCLRLQR